jgi:hypothetical protein
MDNSPTDIGRNGQFSDRTILRRTLVGRTWVGTDNSPTDVGWNGQFSDGHKSERTILRPDNSPTVTGRIKETASDPFRLFIDRCERGGRYKSRRLFPPGGSLQPFFSGLINVIHFTLTNRIGGRVNKKGHSAPKGGRSLESPETIPAKRSKDRRQNLGNRSILPQRNKIHLKNTRFQILYQEYRRDELDAFLRGVAHTITL